MIAKLVCFAGFLLTLCKTADTAAKSKENYGLIIDTNNLYGDETFLLAGVAKTINCRATNKNQKVQWVDPAGDVVRTLQSRRVYVEERFVQSSHTRIPALVLVFKQMAVGDSGVWECRSGEVSRNVSLCVIDTAVFVNTPTEVSVDLGRSITLTCQARGNPEPTLLWYRHGEIITDDNSNSSKYKVMTKYNSQGFEGLLTVMSLESDDSGVYTCEAVQDAPSLDGCTFRTDLDVMLNVNYAPQFENENDTETVYAMENERVDINCFANGYPTPTYRIFKEMGDVLLEIPKHQIKLEDNETKIVISLIANASIFGQKYKCRASNVFGIANKDFIIARMVKPSRPDKIVVYNSSASSIQFNVSWSEEFLFPIDFFEIQFIEAEILLKRKVTLPREVDWKKSQQASVVLDEADPEIAGTFATLSRLKEATEYFVRLRAVNQAGNSPWSDFILASTTAAEEEVIKLDELDQTTQVGQMKTTYKNFSDTALYGIVVVVVAAVMGAIFICMKKLTKYK